MGSLAPPGRWRAALAASLVACSPAASAPDAGPSAVEALPVSAPTASASALPPSPYEVVTPRDLVQSPQRWSGRAVELVDAWGGFAEHYRPADEPAWFELRWDPSRWSGPKEQPGTQPDLRRIQGVFRTEKDGRGGDDRVLELHRVTPLPHEPALPVTLEALEAAPKELDRRRVEVTGTYRAGFERSSLGEHVWLEPFSKAVADERRPFLEKPVRVVGRFYSKKGGYGHLNAYRGLLVAESFRAPP